MRALTSGFRSTPEQKARPLPLRTTARTSEFSASASIWRKSAKPIAVLQAFSRSGRFKLTTATCSSISTITASEKSSAITDLLGRSGLSEREEQRQGKTKLILGLSLSLSLLKPEAQAKAQAG